MLIWVAVTYRVLKKQAMDSPCLGYELKDVYDKAAQIEHRRFDGRDANSLIEILNRRCKYEDDFYYTFELDVNN